MAAPQATASVAVIWPFGAFNNPTLSSPSLNPENAGSKTVLKFSLGGDRGLSILASGSPTAMDISCATNVGAGAASQIPGSITCDAKAGLYSFSWKTDKAYGGTCQKVVILLADGTAHEVLFTFK